MQTPTGDHPSYDGREDCTGCSVELYHHRRYAHSDAHSMMVLRDHTRVAFATTNRMFQAVQGVAAASHCSIAQQLALWTLSNRHRTIREGVHRTYVYPAPFHGVRMCPWQLTDNRDGQ